MASNNGTNKPSRDILPIPDITPPGLTTFDAKDPDTKYPPIVPLRPPEGAPNVLIVLLDDVGFGASSAFGGPINTLTAERLAANGLLYNRFHTTALCAPTRAALLAGRNHHSIGFGAITEMATSAPGNNCLRPNTAAPLAEILKLNGYSTAQFGKCHEVPVWETSPMGPFTSWPSGGAGFEYFYGFIGGETNQYYPGIYEGTIPVEPEKTPEEGYHFTTDMTEKAIKWVKQQKSLMPDKPFFMYFAPGACHAPHHVPKDWADNYKGKFDQGWEEIREATFKKQKELGIIPNDALLSAPPGGEYGDKDNQIPAWDSFSDDMKAVLARQMEVYAGYLEHTDYHVGLLVNALAELKVLDNTLIYYIIGDNGASAEGSKQGTFNEMITLTGYNLEDEDYLIGKKDNLGTEDAYNHYAVGWAHAMNTPYQWTKQVASHFGGTRNACIVHWPDKIANNANYHQSDADPYDANAIEGRIRSQFHHVIDVAPTVLEVANLPEPTFVHGVMQKPMEGVSMADSFKNVTEVQDQKTWLKGTHQTQYFEMVGNRGIYHKGWTAVTQHRLPWQTGEANIPAFDKDVWELYKISDEYDDEIDKTNSELEYELKTDVDWTQSNNLLLVDYEKYKEKLEKLQRQWLIEAVKYNVIPLDDRMATRSNAEIAGRPQLVTGNSQILYGGMGRLTESSIIEYKNKSFTVTAELDLSKLNDKSAEGVIIAVGGRFGGWTLYAKNDKLKYCYNFFGWEKYEVECNFPSSAGTFADTLYVQMKFHYDVAGTYSYDDDHNFLYGFAEDSGLGNGALVTLSVETDEANLKKDFKVEELTHTNVLQTEYGIFSADECCDVGFESGSPVTDYGFSNGNKFNGEVNWVKIEIPTNSATSSVPNELRARIAMGIQ
ncbi:MAG: arylsulfatase [Aphanizomenon sp.]|jgi:arylsulfatase A-like enzyme